MNENYNWETFSENSLVLKVGFPILAAHFQKLCNINFLAIANYPVSIITAMQN